MNDGVQQAAARSPIPAQVNEPVKIFISYAGEDADILNAVYESLDRLVRLSNANIRIEYDKKSLDFGPTSPLLQRISDQLYLSDYLVILYTGTLKKSFSWTGTELGVFLGLINADMRDHGQSNRQIIVIYFDEKPQVDWGALELNLGISSIELQMPRDIYRANVVKRIGGSDDFAQLVSTFEAIGAMADARLPAQMGQRSFTPGQWQKYQTTRSNEISADIVPDLMVRLHDSFSRRVKITNIEQRLIEFRIPKTYKVSDEGAPLPDDTELHEQGGAFSLFKVGAASGSMTWGSFKAGLSTTTEAPWIIESIERSAISAISPGIERDDEQIIRATDNGPIFRLIITRRFEFFDGSKVVNMYFIPVLRFAFLEKSNAAIALGFINVAVKYWAIFIDRISPLNRLDYYRPISLDDLKIKVRRSMRELLIIEDESHLLRLDQWESIAKYYGGSEDDAKRVGEMQQSWNQVRNALKSAAILVLNTSPTAPQKQIDDAKQAWVSSLNDFVRVSEQINADTLRKAIFRLKSVVLGAAEPDPVATLPATDADGAVKPLLQG